jgi:Fe2+ transport system protein FeoA
MVYEVIDVPQSDNCENCVYCMRLKLMEFGFIAGQNIEIQKKQWGLYVVNMISKQGYVEQTIALRKEEFDRICLKENDN